MAAKILLSGIWHILIELFLRLQAAKFISIHLACNVRLGLSPLFRALKNFGIKFTYEREHVLDAEHGDRHKSGNLLENMLHLFRKMSYR